MARVKKNTNKLERITLEVEPALKQEMIIYCAKNGIKTTRDFIISLIQEKIR